MGIIAGLFAVVALALIIALISTRRLLSKAHARVAELEHERNKTTSLHQAEATAAELATNAEIFEHFDRLVKEKNTIEEHRQALVEKNKKIWKMSEAALREKQRFEEMAAELKAKNELLDTERARLADKVKKLWQTSITVHKEREKANNAKENLAAEREKHLGYIQAQGDVLKDIAFSQAHEVRGPLSTLMGLVNLINLENIADPENIELIQGISTVAGRLDNVVTELVNKENNISLNQLPTTHSEEME